MSKEHITYPSRQLKPEHLDALHLIKSFVKEYEGVTETNIYKQGIRLDILNDFYESCKNYGF
tara:strand:+ start:1996 stop:2181 length:186 start_codon:yes stop_codon:yes gene_type:complete